MSKGSGKSGAGRILSGLLTAAVVLLLLWWVVIQPLVQPHGNATADYAEAGEQVKSVLLAREDETHVYFNTDSYNPIIGAAPVYNKIIKQAMAFSGDPREGDHLAIGSALTEVEYVQVPQKDGTDNLNMTLRLFYYTDKEQEQELADRAADILAGLNIEGASDYEKARAIYNYICANVTYDYEHLDDDDYHLKSTAYAAAVNGTAVCSGIADLFYYLANTAGVEAHIKTNDDHAWNFVKIDGLYYYADPTWDLGKSEAEYEYFLKGAADFPAHPGNITFEPLGNQFLLKDTFLDYEFSSFAYGA
ncbi:MAG: hypothetical protein IKD93_07180 [Firmicutes bacterium]|nr:hypothetical protein [Bacillota bacterium]